MTVVATVLHRLRVLVSRFDVFDPCTGSTVVCVRGERAAKRLTRGNHLDYALEGEGW